MCAHTRQCQILKQVLKWALLARSLISSWIDGDSEQCWPRDARSTWPCAYPLLGILRPVFLKWRLVGLVSVNWGKNCRSRCSCSLPPVSKDSLLQDLLMVQFLNCHQIRLAMHWVTRRLFSKLLPTVSVASGGIIKPNRCRKRFQTDSPPGQSVCAWEVWETVTQRFMTC